MVNDQRPVSWLERARRVREGDVELADRSADVSFSELQDLVATILRRSFDAVVLCTKTGEYLEVSDSFCVLTGYSRAELLGESSATLGLVDPEGVRRTVTVDVLHKVKGIYDNIIVRKDGTPRVVEFSHQFLDSGFILVIIRDVTERRLREQELNRLAREDPLTGALNRRGFANRATALLEDARANDATIHLVVADVDRLKALNDELGHEFGDHALIAVASALRIAHGADAVVGRLGGDEFAVAVSGQTERQIDAALITVRLILSRAKIGPAGDQRAVTVSIGVARPESPTATIETLIGAADAGQYVEKRGARLASRHDGRNRAV